MRPHGQANGWSCQADGLPECLFGKNDILETEWPQIFQPRIRVIRFIRVPSSFRAAHQRVYLSFSLKKSIVLCQASSAEALS